MQKVFEAIYDLVQGGEYALLDGMMSGVDVSKLSVQTILTVLAHTRPAEKHFQNRDAFFKRCWEDLERRGRDAKKLLGGLEHWSNPFRFDILPPPPEPKELNANE